MQLALNDVTEDQANLATNVVDALKKMRLMIADLQKKLEDKKQDQAKENKLTYAKRRLARKKKWDETLT